MTAPPALTRRRLDGVRAKIAALSDAAFHLDVSSPPADVESVAEAAFAVYDMLRDLSRPRPVTGCPKHPMGAADPLAPEGWGGCLLCNDARRLAHRGSVPAPPANACVVCHRPFPRAARLPADGMCADCRAR
jgi:hypothetical protein